VVVDAVDGPDERCEGLDVIPLEFTGEYGVVQRNFDRIAERAVDSGDQSAGIRFGLETVTITTSAGSVVIDHGLGRTPVSVVACLSTGGTLGAGGDSEVITGTFTATQATITVRFYGGSFTGNTRVSWIAIG
jgi:hypothetical protein